jgi:hypothetical protein
MTVLCSDMSIFIKYQTPTKHTVRQDIHHIILDYQTYCKMVVGELRKTLYCKIICCAYAQQRAGISDRAV